MAQTREERIRKNCDLAGMPSLADEYIKAGFTVEQATVDLLKRKTNKNVVVQDAQRRRRAEQMAE